VHPYFTRRPANVVRAYIKHYTAPGETVLDPFGGSGVTAIEAMLLNRCGIHNDINPLANFVAEQIADTTVEPSQILEALCRIEATVGQEVKSVSRLREDEVRSCLQRLPLPANIVLPRTADVKTYYELFSPRQLLALGLLKRGIDELGVHPARGQLLLAWSAALAKLNKTFLSAKGRLESRGGSSIFSIFRYKVARSPVELPAWTIFRDRVMNVVEAKREMLRLKHL
jgi:adenine-specific DNA methylase